MKRCPLISLWLLPLCVLALAACGTDDEAVSPTTAQVGVGDSIPSFVLSGSDGTTVSSASLAGQTFVLNFFDTGCPDCQQELQVLQRIYEKYCLTAHVLNVPRSQSAAEVQAYWDKAGLTMPFYTADDSRLYYKFAQHTIPRTYVIDGRGVVCGAYDDSPTADFETLDAVLQQALAQTCATTTLSLRLKVPPMVREYEGTGARRYEKSRSDANEFYFHNEYTISRLEVFLFDADTKLFVSKAVVMGLTQEESLPDEEYDITYLFDNVRLRAGFYDIFLIANYDHTPTDIADEATFLDMVDDITYSDGVEANMPDKGPVMTSRPTALLGVDLVPWINKNYVLTVELERVMAKLLIGVSQNTFQLKHNGRKYTDINITNYKLVNLNRQYYLFQHKDSLTTLGSQPAFTMPANYGDYHDQGEQYVVDPLFYKKTTNAWEAASFGQHYRSWFGSFTTEHFASMPSADNYGYAYVLENTTFKTAQKNGYSPGIIFKAAVNPVFVYLYDAKLKTLREEYRPEYWPKTIYLYKYNFYESIQAVNLASGMTLDELENYTDSQLRAYGVKQCHFNMGVYETYYTYWIHHRQSAVDVMGPMEYGIVRNNFYKMIVTGVSGLGDSSITPDIMRDNYPNSYLDM